MTEIAVAPPVKAKYQRTAKGRKSQKVNLMLAAVAEETPPVAATSPLLMPHGRGPYGPSMGTNYGHMPGSGGFMENGGGSGTGGGFQHQFYGHIHGGSPHGFYGGGGGEGDLRGLPTFDQEYMRGGQQQQAHHHQQQQRPFYTTAGGGMVGAGGGMKQHTMEAHEQDYDALHRHHLSPPGGGVTVKRDCHGDANNNCDFSEMRMFNGGGGGIKSEFTGEDHLGSGGGGVRLNSPMTNTNATTPDDVLEEL